MMQLECAMTRVIGGASGVGGGRGGEGGGGKGLGEMPPPLVVVSEMAPVTMAPPTPIAVSETTTTTNTTAIRIGDQALPCTSVSRLETDASAGFAL
jgi:hypothetical protein